MSKQYIPVKTYLAVEEKDGSTWTYLVIEKPDGTKLQVNVFNGGGYVTQLMLEEEPQEVANLKKGTKQ